jgi:hypothetical protein
MVPGMALMKTTVIKREYISKFVSVVKWRIKFARYIDVPVTRNATYHSYHQGRRKLRKVGGGAGLEGHFSKKTFRRQKIFGQCTILGVKTFSGDIKNNFKDI